MAYRVLEVTLLSARDLKRVNLISRMEVYAVVTISGDPLTRQCTQPDPYGGRHPSWNTSFRFNVPATAATATGCLHVLLRTERALGDRDVGEVIVPVADILTGGGAACDPGPRPPQLASYQVRKVHRCEPRGMLNVSYRLGPIVAPQAAPLARADETAAPYVGFPVARSFYAPPYAYLPAPAPAPAPLSLPPPPHPQTAGGHDVMAVHPPTPSAGAISTYNLPPAAYPPQTKGNGGDRVDFGVGLGAGLVSGAISGMLAGDMMMSEAAAYNYGYRAGLADGGAGATVYKKNSHAPHVQGKVEANRTVV
ncbi:protein SRC2-like [Panicum miliaceum]|uniref:Protein SRC2-like n=1 Tax=Panicum miliaceum TaxID=4540 RepID=A0A3L6T6Z9_PANMI|nr:protein SRC2-like [Panicum miliaceum]